MENVKVCDEIERLRLSESDSSRDRWSELERPEAIGTCKSYENMNKILIKRIDAKSTKEYEEMEKANKEEKPFFKVRKFGSCFRIQNSSPAFYLGLNGEPTYLEVTTDHVVPTTKDGCAHTSLMPLKVEFSERMTLENDAHDVVDNCTLIKNLVLL
ncbi:hypothetical protein RIF29_30759 [Crotalaria pallida]|uniref:Uncharacterized protein n=1 Tax=Crotalaria pallida TaxID=3830 RepID=A0AAN9EGW3_CROPI